MEEQASTHILRCENCQQIKEVPWDTYTRRCDCGYPMYEIKQNSKELVGEKK